MTSVDQAASFGQTVFYWAKWYVHSRFYEHTKKPKKDWGILRHDSRMRQHKETCQITIKKNCQSLQIKIAKSLKQPTSTNSTIAQIESVKNAAWNMKNMSHHIIFVKEFVAFYEGKSNDSSKEFSFPDVSLFFCCGLSPMRDHILLQKSFSWMLNTFGIKTPGFVTGGRCVHWFSFLVT